jgi:hypothetical protein
MEALQPKKELAVQPVATEKIERGTEPAQPPPPSPMEQKLKVLLDTLGTYFPGTWEPVYERRPSERDWFGRVVAWERYLVKPGIQTGVERILDRYSDIQKKIQIVQKMIEICKKVEENDRMRGIEVFADLMRKKFKDYEYQVREITAENERREAEAESRFAAEKSERWLLNKTGKMGLGSSFVAIALFGLVLCFLAIERNTRAIQELIERERKP